jgi:hypothetical protein
MKTCYFVILVLVIAGGVNTTGSEISNAQTIQIPGKGIEMGRNPQIEPYIPIENGSFSSLSGAKVFVFDESKYIEMNQEVTSEKKVKSEFTVIQNDVPVGKFVLSDEKVLNILWNSDASSFSVITYSLIPEKNKGETVFTIYSSSDCSKIKTLNIPIIARNIVWQDQNTFYVSQRQQPNDKDKQTNIYGLKIDTGELKKVFVCKDSYVKELLYSPENLYIVEYVGEEGWKLPSKGRITSLELRNYSTTILDTWENQDRLEFLMDHNRKKIAFNRLDNEKHFAELNVLTIATGNIAEHKNIKDVELLYYNSDTRLLLGRKYSTKMKIGNQNFNKNSYIRFNNIN